MKGKATPQVVIHGLQVFSAKKSQAPSLTVQNDDRLEGADLTVIQT